MMDLAVATATADRERAAKASAARLSNRVVVGGRLVEALAPESFPVENPATGEVIGSAPRCGAVTPPMASRAPSRNSISTPCNACATFP